MCVLFDGRGYVCRNVANPPPLPRSPSRVALRQTSQAEAVDAAALHEQSLLSTATLADFEVVRSIASGNNGQIFEVACTIPQVGAFG